MKIPRCTGAQPSYVDLKIPQWPASMPGGSDISFGTHLCSMSASDTLRY